MVLAASFAEVSFLILEAVVLALVTTAISLRLLGTRRGWGTALASGVLGWGLAGGLALGLSGWDWGADGLLAHMLAIAVPTTMGVAVALDLLARPGALAATEQAGLVVAPRPVRAFRRRIDVLRGYRELLGLIRSQGFGPFLGAGAKAERAAEPVGIRVRRLLEEAGGVYVKIGQIAATRVDLIPPEICAELASLQNRTRREPRELIEPVLEAELGGPASAAFGEFDWNPLAAASIGQTYRARQHSGEPVVVKVQRPDSALIMERDLAALARLADLAERRTPLGLAYGAIRARKGLPHDVVMSRARIVAVAGLLLSATCVVILHFLRTDLAPRAHRLSEYANGPYGWMMAVAFVALGCGLIALAVALWAERGPGSMYSWIVPGAALAAGVGAIVSGAFRTGVSQGSEVIHSRASALATVALVALVLFYSLPAARRTGATLTLGTGLALIAAGLAAISPLLHETRWTGLSQRLLWIALLAWLLWAARHRPPRWDGEVSVAL